MIASGRLPARHLRYLALLIACLLVAGLCAKSTRPRPSTAGSCQRGAPEAKGAEALRLVRYPYADLGFQMLFLGPRRGVQAITFTAYSRIEVYVRTCQSVASVAVVTGHELGHAVDHRYNDDRRREEYMAARGISPQPWFGCNRCTDFATPAGDFAEVFALYFTPPHAFRGRVVPAPSPDDLGRLERFFRPPPPAAPAELATTTTTRPLCHVALGERCLVP